MIENQLVSVCVPVYNGGLYIEETLISIINQTYKNLEIIVSDNASTDNTGEIVKKYLNIDNRIRYNRNDTNLGYCGNIAKAVSSAKSEFVAIYHADDIYEPEIIEKEINVLKENQIISAVFVKMVIYYSKYKTSRLLKIYDSLIQSELFDNKKNIIRGAFEDYLPFLLNIGNLFACPSFMTRKAIFLKLGGFTDNYPSNEDFELWLKYLIEGSQIAIINEYLFKYRITDSQGSAYWNSLPELPVMYKVIDEMIFDNKQVKMIFNDNLYIAYSKNKAIGYIIAGYNSYKKNLFTVMKKNIEQSKKVYKFSLFSKFGLCQRFPSCVYPIKKIHDYLRIRYSL